jgi:hypothetical protein
VTAASRARAGMTNGLPFSFDITFSSSFFRGFLKIVTSHEEAIYWGSRKEAPVVNSAKAGIQSLFTVTGFRVKPGMTVYRRERSSGVVVSNLPLLP